MDHDLDDTHLCIKCNRKIVGLENYIQHRKENCSIPTTSSHAQATKITPTASARAQHQGTEVTPAITYEPFNFSEPEPPNPTSHGGKTSKALAESYELPYELEADVFFSSLQLQSVQSSVGHHVPSTSGGKTGSTQQTGPLTRQKSLQQGASVVTTVEETCFDVVTPHQSSGEHFLKDVSDTEEPKKSFDTIFKSVTFQHESPEVSEEEDEDEVEVDIDDDDQDYDPMAEVHGSGGKWKLSLMRNSPPVVPVSHTGGKWKPEHRPNLRVAHSQLSRISPTWDDNLDDTDAHEGHHPPSDHTKGKWIPGTKLQRLEYKEEVELAKCSRTNQDYWCNICCRKLRSKTIYENHLKTTYHLKRAEPELQLEKAAIKELPKDDINKSLTHSLVEFKPLSITVCINSKKRKRRSTYLKCSICKHVVIRHLIGKHLISHYHYRRMQLFPGISLPMILDNIHSIVLQSPFQCRPCRFYANTEESFLLHWNSASHLDASEGPGRFWCFYCQFECEDNNQMRRHLLGPEHKEVLLAINRSVPVSISKRLSIDCPKCGQSFRFNFELRRHILNYHRGTELTGTVSDVYQSKFRCDCCPEVLPSKIALQRHEKYKHSVTKYFCSICNLEFHTPCQARRHRKTLEHKQKASSVNQKSIKEKQLKDLLKLKPKESSQVKLKGVLDDRPSTSKQAKQELHQEPPAVARKSFKCKDCLYTTPSKEEFLLHGQREHINSQHNCILCSQNFATAQELGRHTRVCKPATIAPLEQAKLSTKLQEIVTEQGEKIWQCELCDFQAPFRSEILYHRIFHFYGSVGKNQLLPCPLCDKTFRKQSLRFHLHNHTKEKLFKCDICNSSFSRPNNLKDHVKNLHGNESKRVEEAPTNVKDTKTVGTTEKVFPCDSCSKIFKSKHSMKMHHLTHHVEESAPAAADRQLFKCSQENCKYASVSKSLLNVHLNSHSLESFKCTKEDCNYVGKSKLHLKRHLQSHIPIAETKNFSCKQCAFKTKIKSHLQRHMRQHTGEKPYSCPYCHFHSTTWENLRKHILKTEKHAGKFVFECKKCSEEIDKSKEKQENKICKVFKTNSHQEYQLHLKTEHKSNF